MNVNEMNVWQRLGAPTPKFFKRLRDVGLVLGALGGAILTAPISLPPIVLTLAGYLVTVGVVAGGVSQATVDEKELAEKLKVADLKKGKQ